MLLVALPTGIIPIHLFPLTALGLNCYVKELQSIWHGIHFNRVISMAMSLLLPALLAVDLRINGVHLTLVPF